MVAHHQGMAAAARGVIRPRTEFRSSMTSPAGLGETNILLARVVNVDLVHYTVDVYSQFDQQRILSVPIGSPYLHSNRGDGLSVTPEVGSKCAVCWPGDSSPPFVLAFVMPHETVPVTGDADSPGGTSERGDSNQGPSTASFAGGRPKGKPGDIALRGRDGQFVVMHRGGVLQVGSNELSQRLYIPLNNLVMDVAENYAMQNSGGSIRWGLQEGEGETTLPAEYKHTLRVYANEKYADLRIGMGRVHDPVPEADDDGITDLAATGVGKTEPVVCELALAKNGFKAESGALLPGTGNLVKLRFIFDRAGNAFLRMDGNVGVLCKKKLRLRVKGDMEVFADSNFSLNVASSAKIAVGGNLEITSPVVRVNDGDKPVARVGDQVSVTLPPTLLMVSPTPPGFAPIPIGMNSTIGVITSGRSDFLA